MATRWFDSHLDLAYLAASGRDMTRGPAEAGGPDLPAAVTLPSLAAGGVRAALGTIFIEPLAAGAEKQARVTSAAHADVSYPAGDAEAAHRAGLRQLSIYHEWGRAGLVELRARESVASQQGGESREHGRRSATAGVESVRRPLGLSILIEGADCVRTPDELSWWAERGVVAVGLAWANPSRYAAGNAVDPEADSGLTDLGRALVGAMDALGVVHDASHLSDRSLAELFERTDRAVIASHSNCRAIVGRNLAGVGGAASGEAGAPNLQRHLTDASIREIARRGGVIGLNLFSPFIVPRGSDGSGAGRRATIGEWCDHADHVVQVLGHHRAVGLGSDMDGGFSALRLPEGIDGPWGLTLLAEGLARRGWSEEAIEALAWGNWTRFWGVREGGATVSGSPHLAS